MTNSEQKSDNLTHVKELRSRKRTYFDSAEYFMNGKKVGDQCAPHPNLLISRNEDVQSQVTPLVDQFTFSEPPPVRLKRYSRKSRKYFDSADWVKEGLALPDHIYK